CIALQFKSENTVVVELFIGSWVSEVGPQTIHKLVIEQTLPFARVYRRLRKPICDAVVYPRVGCSPSANCNENSRRSEYLYIIPLPCVCETPPEGIARARLGLLSLSCYKIEEGPNPLLAGARWYLNVLANCADDLVHAVETNATLAVQR